MNTPSAPGFSRFPDQFMLFLWPGMRSAPPNDASWRRQFEKVKGMVCAQVPPPPLPYLEDDDKKEVEVGHSVELLIQI